jgi:DnaK suppressor protein
MGMSVPRAEKATSNAATGQVAEHKPAKGARAKGATAKQAADTPAAEKSAAQKSASQKSVADKSAGKRSGTETPAAKAATKASAKATAARKGGSTKAAPTSDPRAAFLERQRELLLAERTTYTSQAAELKAQADSLALEHEPGDVQFDEEGGEGGTSNVDRELDLILSGQALAAITEIDLALAKIAAGTYGICEQCGKEIPEPRLEALPHASLCVSCKSGGLSSRR